MLLSVRLDPKTENAVKRLARRRKQSRSQVVRDAIAALDRAQAAEGGGKPTPYEAMKHLIGIVRSGDGTLSQNTGEKFAELLRKDADARRRAR